IRALPAFDPIGDKGEARSPHDQDRFGDFEDPAVTPKSADLASASVVRNPSAASPRLSNSRTAEARLGMRREKRQSSSALSSAAPSMIWSRSTRFSSIWL